MKKVFFLGFALLTMWSCENFNDSSVKLQNYMPMTVGNYWIYQHYRIDSTGLETKLSFVDSVAIIGDTTINNKKYYVRNTNGILMQNDDFTFTRDSAGYLVNNLGKKLFSTNNFTDTLRKITYFDNVANLLIYTSSNKMEKHDGLISVPAGNFEVLNSKMTVKIYADYKNDVWNLININKIPVVYNYAYYAPKVGKILNSYIYLNNYKIRYESRLIRFKIK